MYINPYKEGQNDSITELYMKSDGFAKGLAEYPSALRWRMVARPEGRTLVDEFESSSGLIHSTTDERHRDRISSKWWMINF